MRNRRNCLFANLSLRFDAAFPADGHLKSASPYEFHCAAGPGISCPRQCRNVCTPYFDSSSNPMAAVLPRRCQPLVTRISSSDIKLRCAQLVKHQNPYLAISIAVFFGSFVIGSAPPPHRAPWLRGFVALHPSGRFRNWKLVVSGRHSKRFFA